MLLCLLLTFVAAESLAGWSDIAPGRISAMPGLVDVHSNSGPRRIVRVGDTVVALAPHTSRGDHTYRSIDSGLTWQDIDDRGGPGVLVLGKDNMVYHFSVNRRDGKIELVRFAIDANLGEIPDPISVYADPALSLVWLVPYPSQYDSISATVDRVGDLYVAVVFGNPSHLRVIKVNALGQMIGGPWQVSADNGTNKWFYPHLEVSESDIVMCTYRDWDKESVFAKSTDGGATWQRTTLCGTWDYLNQALLPVGRDTVYVFAQLRETSSRASGLYYTVSFDSGDSFPAPQGGDVCDGWTLIEPTCGYADPSAGLAANGDIYIAYRSDNYPEASGTSCGDRSRERLVVLHPDGQGEVVDAHIYDATTASGLTSRTGTRSQVRYQTFYGQGGPLEWIWMQQDPDGHNRIYHDMNPDIVMKSERQVQEPPPSPRPAPPKRLRVVGGE